MSHDIVGQRFFHNRETPAWHWQGINRAEALTAGEAMKLIGGEIRVEKHPLYVNIGGEQVKSNYFALVREPIPEDPQYRVLGDPVSENFELITLGRAAELWDQNVRKDGKPAPVETMGVLAKGGRLFISTELPSFDVAGDEIKTYLLYDNPLIAGRSLGVYTTNIRTVCQNTLTAAIARAVESRRISHHAGAIRVLANWLSDIYEVALVNVEVMKEAYNILAKTPVSVPQIKWVITSTYPLPPEPKADDPNARLPIEKRLETYEYNRDRIERAREFVFDLSQGMGVGMDSPATAGTAFGLWNAIAEFETYRAGSAESVVRNLLNGDRADRIRTAFDLSYSLAKQR